jgi:formate hydrogenlyase subunit 6/NADH:ubiquinone oxidoreductase subunit I
MLKLFKRVTTAGLVTSPYPAEPEPAPARYRGQVQLDTSRCRGDAACARACPSGAIAVEPTEAGWVWRLNDARCVFCGLCQDACANNAVSLSNEFELAVRTSADLQTDVVFTRKEGAA